MNREAIRQALFTLVSTAKIGPDDAFVTKGERLVLFDKLTPDQMPAFMLGNFEETYQIGASLKSTPPKVIIETQIFIYNSCLDQDVIPDVQVNNILDALDPLFFMPNVPNGYWQTLNGKVDVCWIDGKVKKAPGYIDGVGLTQVPVKMVVPF